MANYSKIARNTLFLYFKSLVTLMITLYTSRVILEVLGIEDFGIYNVVGGVVGMIVFLNTTIAATYQRYYNYEIGRKCYDKLANIFKSSLTVQLIAIVVVTLIAETIGLWFINNKLVIPADRIDASQLVYHISVISFAVSMIQAPFTALIIAYEKMGIFALVSILDAVLKLAIALSLSMISGDKLIAYAWMQFGVIVINTIIYIVIPRLKFSSCKISFRWNLEEIRSLLSFAGLSMMDSMSYTFKSQGLNILLNIFFGPAVNAARGIAYQVLAGVEQFVRGFQTSFRPQITQLYAEGDLNSMYKLYYVATKISFYMIWCLSLPIMLNISEILNLWLSKENVPEYAGTFTVIVLLTATISAYANPTSGIIYAIGRIKIFTIVVSGFNLLILPLAYVVLKLGANPQYALIVSLVLTIFAQVARLLVLKYLERSFSLKQYCVKVVWPTISVAAISIIIPMAMKLYINKTEEIWYGLSVGLVAIVSVLFCIFIFGLDKLERNLLLSKIKDIIQKK